MRQSVLCALLLLARPALADEPGLAPPAPEEPGLARTPPVKKEASAAGGFWQTRERGPRLKLGYRTFSVAEMSDRDARYHCFDLDVYIYSGYLRGGLGVEAGAEDSERDNFVINGVINLGAQYPARITPFADLTTTIGVLRRDVLDQDLVNLAYSFGIEGGAEVFVAGGVLVSVALGWRRQVFRHGGDDQVETVDVYFDSFTAKVGLGF